ncbi:MAG: type II toxin-antitoxin system Phd/YefM family antitoxin [Paracoccaceae bacterium]
MKSIPASVAAKSFGSYLDAVQREPIIVTKKDRPVAVTLSIQDAAEFREFQIQRGIARGLADVDAGRFEEMTVEATARRIKEFKARLSAQR